MSNSKHTPGPWHIIETGPIRQNGPTAYLLANPSPHVHGVMEGVSDADCALIAAAPDMLEALEGIEIMIRSELNGGPRFTPSNSLEMIQAVIKKARG